MKHCLFALCALLFTACGGDVNPEPTDPNPTPENNQTVTVSCSLTAPSEGAVHNPAEKLTIKGEGSIEGDEWGSVTLKVGQKLISEIKTLPFTYAHTFDSSTANGKITLTLEARGKKSQKVATSKVSIQLERPNARPENITYVVAKDGTGDYTEVQKAINALKTNQSKRQVIYIKRGTYHEKFSIPSNKPFVTLIGEDAATTILSYDDYAGKATADGGTIGTQNSAAFTISATDFQAQNLTFQNPHINNTGNGDQAVAVGVFNDRASFYNCRLVGYQDTFYVKNKARVYCKDCYIEGNVDFIFGDAVLLCENCQLHCNRHDSVITAAAEHTDSKFGYTFLNCRLTHIEGKDFNGREFKTFYLGRPWKQNARVVYIRCDEPALLHAAAWRRMSEGVDAALFAEYQCTGAGAAADRLAKREMGGRLLTDAEAATYTLQNIFSRATNPTKYNADWTPDAPIVIK
jgi:pectinesterase